MHCSCPQLHPKFRHTTRSTIPALSALAMEAEGIDYDDLTVSGLKKLCRKRKLNALGDHASRHELIGLLKKAPRRALKQEFDQNQWIEELQCPVCLESMHQPIYQCPAGHSICGTCHSIVDMCPECQQGYNKQNPTRNFVLEKICSKVKATCPFAGCGKELELADLEGHQDTCEFRPFKCRVPHLTRLHIIGSYHSHVWSRATTTPIEFASVVVCCCVAVVMANDCG